MADRFNTIAGWTLFSGIVALGLSSIAGHYFEAGRFEKPEKAGYTIAGVSDDEEGGAAAGPPIEALLATADVAKGEASFKKCMSCHSINQGGANGQGPNLHAILGDGIGVGRGGFAFSDALKAKGGKWDWTSMNAWLEAPSAFASGTKMSFAGLTDPQERANVMAYLNAQGSNLPLPAVPAVPAAPAAGAAAAPAVALVGDAAKGQKSFAKCASCHTIAPGGANGQGPNLAGIYGDKQGEGRGGYPFSDGLKAKGGVWDEASLDAWLTSPSAYVSGTKMGFAGLTDPQERANVIAYLKTAK